MEGVFLVLLPLVGKYKSMGTLAPSIRVYFLVTRKMLRIFAGSQLIITAHPGQNSKLAYSYHQVIIPICVSDFAHILLNHRTSNAQNPMVSSQ
uniref:Uncharacterized protein n=1 Tax=Oryza meridionalis TaxID=40149 RepID=A0A0E0F1X2_9ORYZ